MLKTVTGEVDAWSIVRFSCCPATIKQQKLFAVLWPKRRKCRGATSGDEVSRTVIRSNGLHGGARAVFVLGRGRASRFMAPLD